MPLAHRVQTGVRIEQRTLKVLKALAEYLDFTLGDLLEGVVLHAFEGKAPFSADTLVQVKRLCTVYGLELTAADSHSLREGEPHDAVGSGRARSKKPAYRK